MLFLQLPAICTLGQQPLKVCAPEDAVEFKRDHKTLFINLCSSLTLGNQALFSCPRFTLRRFHGCACLCCHLLRTRLRCHLHRTRLRCHLLLYAQLLCSSNCSLLLHAKANHSPNHSGRKRRRKRKANSALRCANERAVLLKVFSEHLYGFSSGKQRKVLAEGREPHDHSAIAAKAGHAVVDALLGIGNTLMSKRA